MKFVAALFSAAVAGVSAESGKRWLASSSPTSVYHSEVEFRGNYAGFDLVVAPDGHSFGTQIQDFGEGNDGLWVVEFDTAEIMAADMKLIADTPAATVVHQQGMTVVVGGGEELTEALGYDACGENLGKRVISVPHTHVEATKRNTKMETLFKAAEQKDPAIVAILDLIDERNLETYIKEFESYNGRNSYSGNFSTSAFPKGSLNQAADYAAAELERFGFQVTRDSFRNDITPQIIARLPGTENPDDVIVMGAHFDSRGTQSTSPSQRAPGADDNGTGSAVLLEFARIISESGVRFKNTLDLALFTGEEQGLIGSRAMARRYKDTGVNVIGMFNSDMIGYTNAADGVTLALMNRNADADLTALVMEISTTYVGDQGLTVGLTNVCCSDQQAFWEQGFASVGYFETLPGSVVYPDYHRSTDALESGNINMRQVFLSGTATMASTMVYAELA